MKEVVVEIPRVDKVTKFEATDGTQFESKEECRKYEASALGVMRGRIQEYVVTDSVNEWELLGGSDDHTVTGFRLPTEDSVNVFLQWMYLECPYYLNDYYTSRKEEHEIDIKKAQKNGDIILMGQNCDNDFYYINTRQNIIDNLMNLDKKKDESKEK